MIRKAFVMSVLPGCENEYRSRHSPIWPDLEETLRSHGVKNYSIFLHPNTLQLFAYVEFESESQWMAISQTEVCKKWWDHMKEIMPTNSDNSPVVESLDEVFHFD